MPLLSSAHRPTKIVQGVLLAALLSAYGVVAQDSDVTSCIPGLEWLVNDKGQSACLLASYLRSSCLPTPVNAIPEGTHYLGPQTPEENNACVCSTVVYSLTSACGACQGRRWAGWARWSTNCSTEVTSYGEPFPRSIPAAAEIPRWAYMDIRAQANQTWNPTLAFSMRDEPTVTNSNSTPTPTNAPTNPSSNSSGGGGSNTGAIAGGVVGGVVFLLAVALLAFWMILRRRKAKVPKDFEVDSSEVKTQPTGHTHLRSPSQAPMLTGNSFSPPPANSTLPSLYGEPMVAPNSPPNYYQNTGRPLPDMSDTGSVMPMSPGSAVYTTLPSRRSFESFTQSQPSHFGSLLTNAQRGGYTGAAEPA